MITEFSVPEIDILLVKLKVQGWTKLFLQGDFQRQFAKPKMTEFYGRGIVQGFLFSTTIHKKTIHLLEDISRIVEISNEGWDHYIKNEWPPLDNMA